MAQVTIPKLEGRDYAALLEGLRARESAIATKDSEYAWLRPLFVAVVRRQPVLEAQKSPD